MGFLKIGQSHYHHWEFWTVFIEKIINFLKFYHWSRKWRSILLWLKWGLKVKIFPWPCKTVLHLSANWQHEGQTKRKPSHKTLQLDIVISFSGLALGTDNASANRFIHGKVVPLLLTPRSSLSLLGMIKWKTTSSADIIFVTNLHPHAVSTSQCIGQSGDILWKIKEYQTFLVGLPGDARLWLHSSTHGGSIFCGSHSRKGSCYTAPSKPIHHLSQLLLNLKINA